MSILPFVFRFAYSLFLLPFHGNAIARSLLPIYAAETGGEFGSVCFVVNYTLAALSVPRTFFLGTGTFYIIMRTGHGYYSCSPPLRSVD
jgi:hypothetical protein